MDFPLGYYIHYKEKRYKVVRVAVREDDMALLVIYEPCYAIRDLPQGTWFVRTLENFTETVEVDGIEKPRFRWDENQSEN